MLQRIQTVFMFLATIAGVLIFFFPVATYISNTDYLSFFIHTIESLAPQPFEEMASNSIHFGRWFTIPLAAGQLLIIIILFYTIFQYKKRVLQIRLNTLNIFLNVLLVGGIFYYATLLEGKTGASSQYGVATIFPLIVIVLLFIANYNIRKDERLIRSSNRLR
ncbi:MAG: DUF4293 domain-containing protein [Bacteroidales bacterium]|nr:DUF4293 domain-containing protein [Bacteroidales bacterium]